MQENTNGKQDLAALAAECERRAAAGEKPQLDWRYYLGRYGSTDHTGYLLGVPLVRVAEAHDGYIAFLGVDGGHRLNLGTLSTIDAAKLLCESVLNFSAAAELDALRARAEAAEAEVARLMPLGEAAIAYVRAPYVNRTPLADAAYQYAEDVLPEYRPTPAPEAMPND